MLGGGNIEYADQRTAPFPISKDAYANIWQDSLDHHLAEQMDHVSVREGYRVWHGASHLDDGRLAPVVGEQFDGWNQATATDGKWKGGDHIPGMNVGGWWPWVNIRDARNHRPVPHAAKN